MKVKIKNRSHRRLIDQIDYLRLGMYTNIVIIRSVSVWWCLYVLSNTKQYLNLNSLRLSWKKAFVMKKTCYMPIIDKLLIRKWMRLARMESEIPKELFYDELKKVVKGTLKVFHATLNN